MGLLYNYIYIYLFHEGLASAALQRAPFFSVTAAMAELIRNWSSDG